MRQPPQLVNMADIVSSLMHTRIGLVRPTSNAGILSRIKLAWLVLIGDCDALNWGAWKADTIVSGSGESDAK